MKRLATLFLCIIGIMLGAALPLQHPAMAQEQASPETAAASTSATATATPDPAHEARAQYLFRQLRCVVCAGQSLADSNALLADDMRGLVRKQLASGHSDQEILDYFVAQYGEQILMRPPVNLKNGFLWLIPILLLVFGASRIYNYFYSQPND